MIELPSFDALALSLHHSPGVYAVLVGSGLSRAAGIPTGWEITLDLIRRLAALEGITQHDDWEAWFRQRHGKDPNYSEILDALASTPTERRAILHDYIEQGSDEGTRQPTKAHHAIAQLVAAGTVRVIITTNFDRLLENALREAGIEPTVIANDDAVAGATPLIHTRCTLIKVHGDYLDTRIKNTDDELAGYSPAMNTLLDQVFDTFGLVTVGWSGEWDMALRSAILRAPSRRYPLYWAARGTIGTLAQDILDQRGARSFAIADADSFFVRLSETLDALRQASRPHPQSVSVAIALAKRYCRDDRFALEWAEFLHAEVEKIRRFVNGPEYPTVVPTADTLNALVNALITRSEILRRSCMISGRWGTEQANREVIRNIRSLSFLSEMRGGYTAYISLRDLTATLVFYWNAAGSIARDDWSSVKTLFNAEIKTNRGNSLFVSMLPILQIFSDWKFLKGYEKRRLPASDFVFEQFKVEAGDIACNEGQADALFDQTELTIALEFAHQRIIKDDGNTFGFWSPLGRFIWKDHGQTWNEALTRIENLPDEAPLFNAGLFGGSSIKAATTFKELRDFFVRVGGAWF